MASESTIDFEKLLRRNKNIRAIGFDDASYGNASAGEPVGVAGAVCAGVRFEGLLWGSLQKDGTDATETLRTLLSGSKFAEQIHLILTDGITFGGANVVDIAAMAEAAATPVIAVMRKPPDLEAFRHVIGRLPEADQRERCFRAAGPIHEIGGWTFQTQGGLSPDLAARLLSRITDQGKVPEALRLAHLIGAAFVTGESGKRA